MPTETDKTPCVWAADLVARLADSGTPHDKLRPVKDAMAERWEGSTHLDADHPGRHLSAAEALALLADKFGDGHGTVSKARAFVTVGYLEAPKKAAHPAELIPPPPRGAAPVAVTADAEEDAEAGPGAPGRPGPGVVDLSVTVPTTGPKPVAAKPKPQPAPKTKPQPGSKPGVTELLPRTPPGAPPPAGDAPPG